MEEIVSIIGKTNDLVGEIAIASQEQAQGITQISTAVTHLDSVIQKNTASAEESSAASEQVMGVMSNLQHLVVGHSESPALEGRVSPVLATPNSNRQAAPSGYPQTRLLQQV